MYKNIDEFLKDTIVNFAIDSDNEEIMKWVSSNEFKPVAEDGVSGLDNVNYGGSFEIKTETMAQILYGYGMMFKETKDTPNGTIYIYDDTLELWKTLKEIEKEVGKYNNPKYGF